MKLLSAIIVPLLFLVHSSLGNLASNCSSTSAYRSYDGTCNNEENPDWGTIGQTFSLNDNPLGQMPVEPIDNFTQGEDPVTEWLKEVLDFLLEDILDIEVSGKKAINSATPYLDLSNIYDTFTGKLLPSSSLFSQVMISEHTRVVAIIASIRQDWTVRKVYEEARMIVTAEYQNIVVKDLMPLLVGRQKAELLTSLHYDENIQVGLSPEEVVLGLGIVEMFGYQNELDGAGKGDLKQSLAIRSLTHTKIGFNSNLELLEQIISLNKGLGVENWTAVQVECPMLTFSETASSNPLLSAFQEKPMDGELLGPTFCCFIFQLVARLISGDKFWFKNQFSAEQSLSIQSSGLSSLICKNLKQEDDSVQMKAFLLPDSSINAPVPCRFFFDLKVESLLSNEDLEIFDEELSMIDEAVELAHKEVDWRHLQEVHLYQKKKIAPNTSGRGSPSFGKPTQESLDLAKSSSMLEIATYKLRNMTDRRAKRSHKSIIPSFHHQTNNIINSKSVNKVVEKKIKSNLRSSQKFPRRPQHHVVPRPHHQVIHRLHDKFHQVHEGQRTHHEVVDSPHTFTYSKPLSSNPSHTVVNPATCSKHDDDAPCDHTSKYRSFNGRCNNLNTPNHGKSSTIFRRLLPSAYEDGISFPRSKAVHGYPLPNPRKVSRHIHTTQATPDPKFTLTMMQWGQFIDHDMVLTPIPRGFNNSILDCKACNSGSDNPSCFPILIPDGDAHFPSGSCMAFTRSLPGQQKLGPREQFNQVTHYLDGSMVYGSNSCEAEELREHNSYLMRMTPNPLSHPSRPMKDLLPMTSNNHECRSADGQCFKAGDERVNEQPGLTTFHTVLVREHNDISKELAMINSHWSNEKVYQETRRIISAVIQHITFNEFLPRVLGPNSMRRFSLELLPTGYYHEYNPKCSAAIFTEFSTAAFRFGHSMIRPNLTMMTEDDMVEGGGKDIPLRNHFNNPDLVRSGQVLDSLVRGMVMAPMEVMDNRVTQEVKDHLFEEKNKKFSGMDLPAINIQRSRDHGIPGYNKYREICGLRRSSKFEFDEIPQAWVDELHGVYKHPDDVDLFPGLLAEIKLSGAAVGPTLACLIGLQFRHLRSCDRFWYESGDPMVRFTEGQLQAVRGETLSGLLCRNCDQPGKLPQSGMDKMQRLTNPMVDCKDMKHIDLEQWREGRNGECMKDGNTLALGTSTVIRGEACTCTGEGIVCTTNEFGN